MSKPKFVFAIKRNGSVYRYIVKLTIDKERKYVGCFETKEQAVIGLEKYLAKRYAFKEGELKNGKRIGL